MNHEPSERPDDAPGAAADGNSLEPIAERKRLAARRRFMGMGAGGAAALMVTVVHKRAFAGSKKTPALQSLCGSAATSPDLKGANGKNVLQQSAMGTPKGLVCNPPPHSCNLNNTAQSQYYAGPGEGRPTYAPFVNTSSSPAKVQYVKSSEFKNHGCGSLTATADASYNYRLYEKGWCPIKVSLLDGSLSYDTTKVYYTKKDNNFIPHDCEPGSY